MGLAKLSLLATLGTFIVLVGIYAYGQSLLVPDGTNDAAKQLMEIPGILMMTLGTIALFMALFLFVTWFRNRLVTYSVV